VSAVRTKTSRSRIELICKNPLKILSFYRDFSPITKLRR
jgi:hypothetical protein